MEQISVCYECGDDHWEVSFVTNDLEEAEVFAKEKYCSTGHLIGYKYEIYTYDMSSMESKKRGKEVTFEKPKIAEHRLKKRKLQDDIESIMYGIESDQHSVQSAKKRLNEAQKRLDDRENRRKALEEKLAEMEKEGTAMEMDNLNI